MENETILQEVKFDPKVKVYWYLQGLWVHLLMIFAVIGVVTFPLWVIAGWFVCMKRYEHMSATLTKTSIHLKKGCSVNRCT